METWKEDIRTCLDELSEEFTLEQVYGFIPKLQAKHALNNNIKAKIRQVLQQLRDDKEILFVEPGKYRRSKKEHA